MANLAEAQTHQITSETFLGHDQAIREAVREHEDTSAAVARAKKAAKSAAVDLTAYKMMERVRKLDEDEQLVVVRHFIQYMQYLEMPVGTQFSMIDAPRQPKGAKSAAKHGHEVFEAREKGLAAGRAGDPASDNPFPPGFETNAAWTRGHITGLSERVTAAEMGDTEDERPADIAPATRRGPGRRKSTNGNASHTAH